MIAIVLIAIAAGCASALMFASIVSGALISLLLFYLAPLPLMVAALGWGPLSATIGGIAARHRPRRDLRPPYCIAFVTHRRAACLVARASRIAGPTHANGGPSGNGAAPAAPLEWYPIGRLLLWIAGFAVLTTMAALLTLGTDAADHHRRAETRPAAHPRTPQRGFGRRDRTMDRCAGDNRAGCGIRSSR